MKEMCMEGQRSEKHIFFCTQTQAGVSLSVHYFVIKESFLLRFRIDYTTINYV